MEGGAPPAGGAEALSNAPIGAAAEPTSRASVARRALHPAAQDAPEREPAARPRRRGGATERSDRAQMRRREKGRATAYSLFYLAFYLVWLYLWFFSSCTLSMNLRARRSGAKVRSRPRRRAGFFIYGSLLAGFIYSLLVARPSRRAGFIYGFYLWLFMAFALHRDNSFRRCSAAGPTSPRRNATSSASSSSVSRPDQTASPIWRAKAENCVWWSALCCSCRRSKDASSIQCSRSLPSAIARPIVAQRASRDSFVDSSRLFMNSPWLGGGGVV